MKVTEIRRTTDEGVWPGSYATNGTSSLIGNFIATIDKYENDEFSATNFDITVRAYSWRDDFGESVMLVYPYYETGSSNYGCYPEKRNLGGKELLDVLEEAIYNLLESERKNKVALLNTSIVTAEGIYKYTSLTLKSVKRLIEGDEYESFIGHQSTSDILTSLLEVEVPVRREAFAQEPGQTAVVFKLKGRPPEGKILTVEEVEEIGYDFYLLERIN